MKTKCLFWRAGFYSANQSNLKSFQKALIGWKKAALQRSHFCFDRVNRLTVPFNILLLQQLHNTMSYELRFWALEHLFMPLALIYGKLKNILF